MTNFLHIFFLFFAPLVVVSLLIKIQPFKFLGAVISCFIIGMIYSYVFSLPEELNQQTKTLYEPLVPLGIAIVLFSTDVLQWIRLSLNVILSYSIFIFLVVIMSVFGFLIFRNQIQQPEHYAAMMTGTYIGGTPNLTAIQMALKIDQKVFTQAFLSDAIASTFYLIFVMVVSGRIIKPFMKKYKKHVETSVEMDNQSSINTLKLADKIINIMISLFSGVFVMGISLGVCLLIYGSIKHTDFAVLLLVITSISVLFSFIHPLRKMKGHVEISNYLFSVFFMALGSLTNFNQLAEMNSYYFLFTLTVLFGSFFMHLLIGYFLKMDHDTLIITSAAGIMSPPFIPSIAGAINNKELIVPGIGAGIIGFAIANIMGVSMYKILIAWM